MLIKNKNKGFMLIELLLVISIIGLIASIAFVSYEQVRIHARNVYTIATVGQYIKALQLYQDDNGKYPDPGNTNMYCYGATLCFPGTVQNPILDSALYPSYLPRLSDVNQKPVDIGFGQAALMHGLSYNCYISPYSSRSCSQVVVYWAMEGHVTCDFNATTLAYGPSTYCYTILK